MDLKQLSYFVTVIQEGTISGRCPETPPDPAAFKRTDETIGRGSRMPAL